MWTKRKLWCLFAFATVYLFLSVMVIAVLGVYEEQYQPEMGAYYMRESMSFIEWLAVQLRSVLLFPLGTLDAVLFESQLTSPRWVLFPVPNGILVGLLVLRFLRSVWRW